MIAATGTESGAAGWIFGAVGTVWAIAQSILSRRERSAKREGRQEGAAEVEQRRIEEQKDLDQRRMDEQKERLEDRDDTLRDEIRRLRDQLGKLFDRLDAVAAQGIELQTTQNLTNTMTAKALESLATKQERHSEQLADHAGTLKLLNSIVTLLQQQQQQQKAAGEGLRST